LRAASIELIIDCSGGEQWSEHFILSQFELLPRLSSVRAPVCRLLGAGKYQLISRFAAPEFTATTAIDQRPFSLDPLL
jgi:hypothetical protein